ncbi:TetR/AcrR family transcriptional regulator [Halomarina litorea]|uniref:TetR/AcrR family transcriptional regulator n=1 Tax=Halomarina litorea TaxID=2961595 RepID=UPI0020C2FE95|nr:TetR/AcrR family transcriptional regulator [Halomarina sp. BCD28]
MTEADDRIMSATYCALCKHGYADLTMHDIAVEYEQSKGNLHYHYDTKRDLLLGFLDHLVERFRGRLPDEDAPPEERLEGFLDATLSPSDGGSHREFRTALLELKAQAPYDEAFRDRLAALDALLRETLRDIVEDGIESGVFAEDADPCALTDLTATVIDGAHVRAVTFGESPAAARELLATRFETHLFREAAEPWVAG